MLMINDLETRHETEITIPVMVKIMIHFCVILIFAFNEA